MSVQVQLDSKRVRQYTLDEVEAEAHGMHVVGADKTFPLYEDEDVPPGYLVAMGKRASHGCAEGTYVWCTRVIGGVRVECLKGQQQAGA